MEVVIGSSLMFLGVFLPIKPYQHQKYNLIKTYNYIYDNSKMYRHIIFKINSKLKTD